jgi:hypothetical protein
MMITPTEFMKDNEKKLELIRWLIERHDNLRASVANRAAIVLSANALFVAGITFLLDKTLTAASHLYTATEKVIVSVLIGFTLILLAASIYYATNGIVSVFKSSRKMFGSDLPSRLFFNAGDSVESSDGYMTFAEKFNASSEEELTTYALSELWTAVNLYRLRYQNLRIAVRLFFVSVVPFLMAITIILIEFF